MRYGMLSSRLPHGYKCLLRVLHVPKKPAFFPFFYSFTKPWVVAACTSHTLLSLPSFPSSPRPTHWPILLRPVVTVASRFPSPSVPSTPQNITAWFRNPSRMFLPYLPTCSADNQLSLLQEDCNGHGCVREEYRPLAPPCRWYQDFEEAGHW